MVAEQAAEETTQKATAAAAGSSEHHHEQERRGNAAGAPLYKIPSAWGRVVDGRTRGRIASGGLVAGRLNGNATALAETGTLRWH